MHITLNKKRYPIVMALSLDNTLQQITKKITKKVRYK